LSAKYNQIKAQLIEDSKKGPGMLTTQ